MRVGIVGTGYIANYHLEVLKRLDGIDVVGCFDINRASAEGFAKRWGIPNWYDSLPIFLETCEVDIMHILTPPDYHFPVAREVLQRGIGVFIEKPMAETEEECKKLVEIAKTNKVVIGVNQNSLFYPGFIKLKEDIANGTIGGLRQVIVFQSGPLGQLDSRKFGHWMFRKPGNVILEQGPHPIAQVTNLLGNVVEMKSMVSGERELGYGQVFFDTWKCFAECEKGSAILHMSFGHKYCPENWLVAIGQDGSIRIDLLRDLYLVQRKSIFPDYLDPLANALRYWQGPVRGIKNFVNYALNKFGILDKQDAFFRSMHNSISAFYENLKKNLRPPVGGEEAIEIIGFCEKWIKNSGANKENYNPSRIEFLKISKKPEILITGATGFIGRKLVKDFASKNIPVRVLVRHKEGLPKIFFDPNIEVCQGSLMDTTALEEAVRGVKVVFHLAHALADDWEDFKRINLDGTKKLVEVALAEKIKYFVFTSTIAVYCYSDIGGKVVTEEEQIDTKPEKRNFYARSKILLEKMLFEFHHEHGLPLVIFRPGIVVGEGGQLYHSGVGQWTRDNVCAYWGMGKNPLPFVLVEDVSSALAKVAEIEGLEGETFNIVGDIQISAREYIELLRSYSGRKICAFPYPIPLCFASEAIKYCIKTLTGAHKNALLSYRDLSNRSIPVKFDNSKIKKILEWRPCTDMEEFNKKCFGWYFDE